MKTYITGQVNMKRRDFLGLSLLLPFAIPKDISIEETYPKRDPNGPKFRKGDIVRYVAQPMKYKAGKYEDYAKHFGALGIIDKVNDNRQSGGGISYSVDNTPNSKLKLAYRAWIEEEGLVLVKAIDSFINDAL